MPQYAIFPLIYKENGLGTVKTAGWWLYTSYYIDKDTFDRLYFNNAVLSAAPLYRYKFIAQDIEGKWFPLFTTDKTSTTIVDESWGVSTAEYRLDTTILYYNTTVTFAVNGAVSNLYRTMPVEIRYDFNVATITQYAPVLLKGSIGDRGGFIIDSNEYLAQEFPTTEDGYYYMYLGYAYATTAIRLDVNHPVYYFKNNKLNIYVGANDSGTALTIVDF